MMTATTKKLLGIVIFTSPVTALMALLLTGGYLSEGWKGIGYATLMIMIGFGVFAAVIAVMSAGMRMIEEAKAQEAQEEGR